MPRKILDTSVLVAHWHKRRAGRPLDQLGTADANAWGEELIRIQDGSVIVTPVYIEFLGGARSAAELKLYAEYLKSFDVLDKHRIAPEDCHEAIRIAQRVPRSGAPRQLGDCLIRAIANRLNADVFTLDREFPR